MFETKPILLVAVASRKGTAALGALHAARHNTTILRMCTGFTSRLPLLKILPIPIQHRRHNFGGARPVPATMRGVLLVAVEAVMLRLHDAAVFREEHAAEIGGYFPDEGFGFVENGAESG